jgi:hypothetical protein
LDYSGGATCPRLLLEPERTNLYNYSEQLNQWLTSSATVTANYAVSPDGYTNADRVQFAAGGLVYVSGTGSAGENTLSVYAKATNGVSAKFRFFANGAVTYSSDQTATGEWQRFTFTYTYSAVTAGLSDATTGADDVIFYGFQHEVGAYATSYIPAIAATTRGADSAYKTGISSLIGQTEGTLYAEIVRTQSTAVETFWITLSDGTINNWLFIGTEATGGRMYIRASNTVIFNEYPAISVGTHKIALAYKSGSIAVYIDGAQIFTSAATYTIGSLTGFALGQSQSILTASVDTAGAVNQALLFKTRLSNADLAALTA